MVELLCKVVTVGLRTNSPGRAAHQDNLLCLRDPGVADEILQQSRDNVVAVEIKILSQLGGVPGPSIHVAGTIRNID